MSLCSFNFGREGGAVITEGNRDDCVTRFHRGGRVFYDGDRLCFRDWDGSRGRNDPGIKQIRGRRVSVACILRCTLVRNTFKGIQ